MQVLRWVVETKMPTFVYFFAKGMCSQGPKCAMWHRVPTVQDKFETTIDCFGRDKFT